MKKRLSLILPCWILSTALAVSLTACGSAASNDDNNLPDSSNSTISAEENNTAAVDSASQPDDSASTDEAGEGVLIAYFSRVGNTDFGDDTDSDSTASVVATSDGLQGNTEVIARMIKNDVGGELFLIETADTYPVSYDETIDVGQKEHSDNARPALTARIENMDDYHTIFLGFLNWWGDMPMAVYSFLDAYDLSGKTIIPFVTSGGSGFSDAENTIAELEPNATVLDGLSVGDSSVDGAQKNVTSWLTGLGLTN